MWLYTLASLPPALPQLSLVSGTLVSVSETKFSLQMQEGHLAPSPDAVIKALNKAS